MTPRRYCGVPEVLSVQEVPSEEVRMVPFQPTVTNDTVVLSVLVVLDLLLLQEMMVKLKRNNEKMMSRCFTWFPIESLGKPNIYHDSGVFYKKWGFYLEGVYLTLMSRVGVEPAYEIPLIACNLFFIIN